MSPLLVSVAVLTSVAVLLTNNKNSSTPMRSFSPVYAPSAVGLPTGNKKPSHITDADFSFRAECPTEAILFTCSSIKRSGAALLVSPAVYLIFCLLTFSFISAQPISISTDRPDLLHRASLPRMMSDSGAYSRKLTAFMATLRRQGYLLANIDTFAQTDGHWRVSVYVGDQFRWACLEADSISSIWVQEAGVPAKQLAGKPLKASRMASIRRKLLQTLENRGHPFGSVSLLPLAWENTALSLSIVVDPGPLVLFDSMVMANEASVKSKFLASYLGFRKGRPYSQLLVNDAMQQLAALPYLKLRKAPTVAFRLGQAYLLVDAEKRPSSQVNGILGLLFDPQRQRPILTGQLLLGLDNLFESGKRLDLQFNRVRASAQQLNFQYEHPSFLGSPVHLQATFGYQQEDSSFVNFRRGLGVGYDTKQGIRIFLQASVADNRLNSRISENPQEFLEFASSKTSLYGTQIRWQRLDLPQAPRKGWAINAEVAAGEKRIRPLLPQSHPAYPLLYGRLRQPQATAKFSLQRFWPLGAQSAVLASLYGGQLFGKQLFKNEMLRIGGLQLLRGFDEYSIFVEGYRLGSAEYRLYFGGTSYLMAFADLAHLQTGRANYWAGSGGFGLSFQSKAGLFKLLYALGQSPGQVATLRNAKVHLGLFSNF